MNYRKLLENLHRWFFNLLYKYKLYQIIIIYLFTVVDPNDDHWEDDLPDELREDLEFTVFDEIDENRSNWAIVIPYKICLAILLVLCTIIFICILYYRFKYNFYF